MRLCDTSFASPFWCGRKICHATGARHLSEWRRRRRRRARTFRACSLASTTGTSVGAHEMRTIYAQHAMLYILISCWHTRSRSPVSGWCVRCLLRCSRRSCRKTCSAACRLNRRMGWGRVFRRGRRKVGPVPLIQTTSSCARRRRRRQHRVTGQILKVNAGRTQ